MQQAVVVVVLLLLQAALPLLQVVVVLPLLQAALPLLQVVVVLLLVVEEFLLQLLALALALVVQSLLFPLVVEVQPVLPPHLHSKSLLSQTEQPSQMIIQLPPPFLSFSAYKFLLLFLLKLITLSSS